MNAAAYQVFRDKDEATMLALLARLSELDPLGTAAALAKATATLCTEVGFREGWTDPVDESRWAIVSLLRTHGCPECGAIAPIKHTRLCPMWRPA